MIVGIDLGTTNSAVAYIDEQGNPSIVQNKEGERVTPSVILFEDGMPIVGSSAKSMSVSDPANTVQFVKRQMGNTAYKFPVDGKIYTPEELSALILKRLKCDAEEALGEPVTEAVITVPAYFDDAQRKATQDAGKISGLNVLKVINEPTAAALAYGLANQNTAAAQNQNVLVYDLGGGTFDVTIINIQESGITVKATAGDRNLGGFDFDNKIFEFVESKFEDETSLDLYDDDIAVQDLREKAEACKKTLTIRKKAPINISSQGHTIKVDITKEDFNDMISPLINRTMILMKSVLAEASLSWPDIDKVLLVGGSTRIPKISEVIEEITGVKPSKDLNPDEVVAMGAAYQAEFLKSSADTHPNVETTKIVDVNSHSLGMITEDNGIQKNTKVLLRNTTIPTSITREFFTSVDGQTELFAQITEGEDEEVDYVKVIGTSTLKMNEPKPYGYPIRFNFSYNEDGLIKITANDGKTGQHLGELEIERSSNLDKQAVEQATEKIAAIDVE